MLHTLKKTIFGPILQSGAADSHWIGTKLAGDLALALAYNLKKEALESDHLKYHTRDPVCHRHYSKYTLFLFLLIARLRIEIFAMCKRYNDEKNMPKNAV